MIRECDRGNNNILFCYHILERKNLISNIRGFFIIVFFARTYFYIEYNVNSDLSIIFSNIFSALVTQLQLNYNETPNFKNSGYAVKFERDECFMVLRDVALLFSNAGPSVGTWLVHSCPINQSSIET